MVGRAKSGATGPLSLSDQAGRKVKTNQRTAWESPGSELSPQMVEKQNLGETITRKMWN